MPKPLSTTTRETCRPERFYAAPDRAVTSTVYNTLRHYEQFIDDDPDGPAASPHTLEARARYRAAIDELEALLHDSIGDVDEEGRRLDHDERLDLRSQAQEVEVRLVRLTMHRHVDGFDDSRSTSVAERSRRLREVFGTVSDR